MKLVLDEWIVREVIDTLYMARTTFLGITGLDSPQEVAKKSANETAITRRISNAIDIIQQSEQPPLPEGLDDAANNYAIDVRLGYPRLMDETDRYIYNAFKAGAEYQRKQDQSLIELAEDHAMLAGMSKMKEEMMEKAVEGVVQDDGRFINFGDGRYIDLEPHWIKPVFELTDGDKVKVIVIKEEK